jgi:hypothetical protein
MTLVIYCVICTDTHTGLARSMGSFDTREEAERHGRDLGIFMHQVRVVDVLWSLAPLGRAS